MAMPNIPVPSTYVSKYFYNRHTDILKNVIKILKWIKIPKLLKITRTSDIPGTWFSTFKWKSQIEQLF